MKKMISLALVAMLALTLSACAGQAKKDSVRVKCPACGYEFETPAGN